MLLGPLYWKREDERMPTPSFGEVIDTSVQRIEALETVLPVLVFSILTMRNEGANELNAFLKAHGTRKDPPSEGYVDWIVEGEHVPAFRRISPPI
jgi:hypothetical protein